MDESRTIRESFMSWNMSGGSEIKHEPVYHNVLLSTPQFFYKKLNRKLREQTSRTIHTESKTSLSPNRNTRPCVLTSKSQSSSLPRSSPQQLNTNNSRKPITHPETKRREEEERDKRWCNSLNAANTLIT